MHTYDQLLSLSRCIQAMLRAPVQVCVEQCMIVIMTLLEVKLLELVRNADQSRPNFELQPLASITVVNINKCGSRQLFRGE